MPTTARVRPMCAQTQASWRVTVGQSMRPPVRASLDMTFRTVVRDARRTPRQIHRHRRDLLLLFYRHHRLQLQKGGGSKT